MTIDSPIISDRLAALEAAMDGVTQEMLDGGWNARSLSKYTRSLEDKIAASAQAATVVMTLTTPSPISDQAAGELLPCPFCGSKAELTANTMFPGRVDMATCVCCGAEAYFRKWNRRSTAPTTGSAPEQRNLEGLREQILAPRGIERDAAGWPVHTGARDSSGWLYHPAIPVCDEGTRVDKLLEAFGIETSFVSMESDASDFYDRWGEEGLCDCSSWVPTPPTGDGWSLLEIYDTEDGPCALFGRDWYEAEKVRKQAERAERRAALLAASMGGDKNG